MTATGLLPTLRQRGVTLEANGERLQYYPTDRATPARVAAIRDRNADLPARFRGVTPRNA